MVSLSRTKIFAQEISYAPTGVIGQFVKAADSVHYLNTPEMKGPVKLPKNAISLATQAQRLMRQSWNLPAGDL